MKTKSIKNVLCTTIAICKSKGLLDNGDMKQIEEKLPDIEIKNDVFTGIVFVSTSRWIHNGNTSINLYKYISVCDTFNIMSIHINYELTIVHDGVCFRTDILNIRHNDEDKEEALQCDLIFYVHNVIDGKIDNNKIKEIVNCNNLFNK